MIRKRLDQEFFSLLEVMLYEKDVRSSSHDDGDDEGGGGAQPAADAVSAEGEEGEGSGESKPHRGTLKIDATCCEAEMRYPTDYNLLEDGSKLTP